MNCRSGLACSAIARKAAAEAGIQGGHGNLRFRGKSHVLSYFAIVNNELILDKS